MTPRTRAQVVDAISKGKMALFLDTPVNHETVKRNLQELSRALAGGSSPTEKAQDFAERMGAIANCYFALEMAEELRVKPLLRETWGTGKNRIPVAYCVN